MEDQSVANGRRFVALKISELPEEPSWNVELRMHNLTIVVDPGGQFEYEIDCESFTCPSECLHWFAHLSGKVWGNCQVLHDIWSHMQTVWKETHGTKYPQRIWPSKYKAYLAKLDQEPQSK